jgi:hypothetical protein
MMTVRRNAGRTGVSPVFRIGRHDGSGNKILVTIIFNINRKKYPLPYIPPTRGVKKEFLSLDGRG